ncbi:MAG TPA: NAD-binding protein, partial [Acidimicrobiales bacterium]|nr:NAD-binding protein [Acidimicrobiales bacterium]
AHEEQHVVQQLHHVAGTVEALVVGTKAGVDPNVLREVVKAGSGSSFAWDHASRAILRDRLVPPTFTVGLATKDISLATTLADDMGVTAPMARLAEELIAGQLDRLGAEDVLAVVKALEEEAGVQVRGRAAQ